MAIRLQRKRHCASLAEAEAENRRGMIACLHASVVAAALLERDRLAEAQAVLANRLDVVERCGFPDIILCAYRTLARIVLGQGDQRRALSVLDNLDALGRRRELPRLRLYALAEQVRIHAGHGWTDAVDKLVRGIDELADLFEHEATLPLQPEYRLVAAIAKVHASLARDDLDAADRHLDAADALATALHRRLDEQRVRVLRAVTARRRGDSRALLLLREAVGMAGMAGQLRVLGDTHPLATQMMEELRSEHMFAVTRGVLPQIGSLVHVESYCSFRQVRRNFTPVEQVKDILPHAVYPLVEQLQAGTGLTEDEIALAGLDVSPEGEVLRRLKVYGLDSVLSVFPTREQALDAVGGD